MYIDKEYYTTTFMGTPLPDAEFARLADIASDVIDMVVQLPVPDLVPDAVKKAVAYEVECLSAQGGIDAITGFSASASSSESLGQYSISKGSIPGIPMVNGLPVSVMTIEMLRKAGLMKRWAYAGCYDV